MDNSGRRNLSRIYKFAGYWWFLAIIAILIMLAIVKVSTVTQDIESGVPAPTPQQSMEVTAISGKPEVNSPVAPEVQLTIDDLELPIPEDVKALARYYGTSGRKNIRDAEVFWQKGADQYIDFLRNETFEQGCYRTYIKSEFQSVAKSYEPHSPAHPDIIRYLARTRRFSKLLSQVNKAKHQGNIVDLVQTISQTVSRLIQQRRDVENNIINMMETEPDAFTARATKDQQSHLAHLIPGVGSTGFVSAENALPMSLQGAQSAVVANTLLLGLSAHPSAVRPIMDILDYDDRPTINALCACERFSDQPGEKEVMNANLVFANRAVAADALDRILVACADNKTLSQEALSAARQYKMWRDTQDLPEREVIQAFTFDSPTTPYHLPGMITGVKKNANTFEFELPLMLWERMDWNTPVDYRLNEDTIGRIIDWAERFHAAAN